MTDFIQKHRKILIALGFVLALLFFKFVAFSPKAEPETEDQATTPTVIKEKEADLLTFGVWAPSQSRAVLAQVESDNEIALTSELSGTLSRVNVNIGNTVRAGQVLAQFKLQNDPTQVNYLNALSNLTATQATADSNVKSAEIALRNAEAELQRTIAQQSQTGNQSLTNLTNQAKSAETTIQGALTFLDRQLGATPAYERESVFGRQQVGSKNFILKNKTENNVRLLVQEFQTLKSRVAPTTEFGIKQYAQDRINFARRVRQEIENYNTLIRDSVISSVFTEADQNNIQAQTDALKPGLDGIVTNLTSLIEGTKGTNEGSKTAILSAENRVKSAREQLEIAKAQSDAQVVGARAQVGSAAAAQTDLTVRAPITGKIVAKEVNAGEQVSFGSPLFTIVNEAASKKVVAFLSASEWSKVQNAETLSIEVNGEMITTNESFLSARADPVSQKIRAEFLLPEGTEALVGSFVKVLIPLQSNVQNLLPISAIAFEPDGAEVLIVGADGIAKRQKIAVGSIVADSVQVLGGLEPETRVVQFRNRVFAGEKIKLPITLDTDLGESDLDETESEANSADNS